MSDQKFYRTPFASAGTKSTIPDTAPGDGSVSYPSGFGNDYQLDPATQPSAKLIPRAKFNQALFDATENIRQYQLTGFPEWVLAAQNAATPVPYGVNAYVRWNGGSGADWAVYCSLDDNNTVEPGTDPTKWALVTPGGGGATQTEVNEGDPTAVGSVRPGTLGIALRQGTITYLGDLSYFTTQELRGDYAGANPFTLTKGGRCVFTVLTANTAADLMLKVGATATKGLKSSTGDTMQVGDLQAGGIYSATYTGVEWRMDGPIISQLKSYGANGDGSIFGLGTAPAAGAPTVAIGVGAGNCRDSTNSRNIQLTAPFTKRLDAVFVAGSGNGGRDVATAPAGGQTWHVHLILNTTTLVADVLFSQSVTSPVLPAGYTAFRRIFSLPPLDPAALIRPYRQTGDVVELLTPIPDLPGGTTNGGGVPYLRTMSVPSGIEVYAQFYFQDTGTISGAGTQYLSHIFDARQGVPPAWGGVGQVACIARRSAMDNGGAPYSYGNVIFSQWTDASQHIYTFSNDNADIIAIKTMGWVDPRGRFF